MAERDAECTGEEPQLGSCRRGLVAQWILVRHLPTFGSVFFRTVQGTPYRRIMT
jgi:hypothetical protein